MLGRAVGTFLVVLALVASMEAQEKEPAKPDTPEQAADKVLAAVMAKDDAALEALAKEDDPDPWLVADELCAREQFDAADAFAKAAPRVDTERLPAYVASQKVNPTELAMRKTLEAVNGLLRARKDTEALRLLDTVRAEDGGVVASRLDLARGLALRALQRLDASAAAFRNAASSAEALGWYSRAAATLDLSAKSAYYRAEFRGALETWQAQLALEQRRGSPSGIATTLGNLGVVFERLGDYAKALDLNQRSLKLKEELGDRAGAARTLGNIGIVYMRIGDCQNALAFQEQALRLKEAMEDRAGIAMTLGNIGLVYERLCEYQKAIDFHVRSLKLAEDLRDQRGVATTLGNIGNTYRHLGDYPKALAYQEQSLKLREKMGDRAAVAMALGNLGAVHLSLGDYPRALEFLERNLRLAQELGDREGTAIVLGNLGIVYLKLGDCAKALAVMEQALELDRELGLRREIARCLSNIGEAHERLGEHARALEVLEQSLRLKEEGGDREGAATALQSIGCVHGRAKDYEKALDYCRRALRIHEELGTQDLVVSDLSVITVFEFASNRLREAVVTARQAIDGMRLLAGGLADEQGATVRERFGGFLGVAALAAARLGDVSEAGFFLESGRAGMLIETLRNREALRTAAIPESLRQAEGSARHAETVAVAKLRDAIESGDLPDISRRRKDLDSAREGLRHVIARIQREAKTAAALLYTQADGLDAIRGRLRDGDALVLYGLLAEESLALVVMPKDARIVALPKTQDVEAACSALAADKTDAAPALEIDALRKLVVDPLGLNVTTTRVLISPDGVLSYVPFALLVPDRDVCYVPSGTTYGLLLEDATKRGDSVLALGDPDYGTKPTEGVVAMRSGAYGDLAPLPATGVEAKAVGTVTLLGKDATESGLAAALVKRRRWRAVHLACHGLVDPERPMFSSLALTPAGEDDGFLTTLEVFRMKIPADLAVLSACETAKGKVYKAEGIVGLTRAFMFAGAPRVIVSLWKVDDEATKALMVKFYELWNPKDGSKGLPTATALKKAMEFVRDHPDHPEWNHPRYWAAWQLWGLPD